MRHSDLIDDRLRSRIFRWRSRCYRRQRDCEGARGDVEARSRSSPSGSATATRSPTATSRRRSSRSGTDSGCSRARTPSGRRSSTRNRTTSLSVGRLLNNLGGLTFLLGDPEEAERLAARPAFSVALEVGSEPDAAQAVSSLAQVHLRTGQPELCRGAGAACAEPARRASRLSRRERERPARARARTARAGQASTRPSAAMAASEATFEQLSSASHRAAAWTAQAELSVSSRRPSERITALPPRRRDPPGLPLLMTTLETQNRDPPSWHSLPRVRQQASRVPTPATWRTARLCRWLPRWTGSPTGRMRLSRRRTASRRDGVSRDTDGFSTAPIS